MHGKSGRAAVSIMTRATTTLRKRHWNARFGDMRADMRARVSAASASRCTRGFGAIRTEMADRNAELLKWLLVFGATQTAALAGVIALLR